MNSCGLCHQLVVWNNLPVHLCETFRRIPALADQAQAFSRGKSVISMHPFAMTNQGPKGSFPLCTVPLGKGAVWTAQIKGLPRPGQTGQSMR